MSVRRYYKVREPGTLKAAEAALIAACGGPVAAADKCSVGKTVLQQASDADHPTRHLSLPVVAQLERACGKPIVTSFLAAEQGYVIEKIGDQNLDALPVCIGRITSEMGELLSAAALDMRAGRLSHANATLVARETDDVIAALLILRAGARRVMEDT
jgi:hypothetical protein